MESSLWIVLNILKGLAVPKQFTVKSPTFLKVKFKETKLIFKKNIYNYNIKKEINLIFTFI